MILDMHVHTILSGDAKPTAADYAEKALELREEYLIDGFVITEHRYWSEARNAELADLSQKTGLVILQGVELETDFGHILVYGVNPAFIEKVDIAARTQGLKAVEAALQTGCIPIPAHPARPMLGCGIALKSLYGIHAIEHLNGGSSDLENYQAGIWMKEIGLAGIGGSDAHYVNELGLCMTEFEGDCCNNKELIALLSSGKYHAIHLDAVKRK